MAEVPLPTPTQAPVPSTDIRNAVFAGAKLDEEVTGSGEFYTDRLGIKRLTNTGRNNQFNAAQQERADQFQQFLLSSGYVFLGDYEDGPFQFSARNQYIRYNDQYYRLNATTDVGFTTTGTDAISFANDVAHFVLMDGDTLRQNLGSGELPGARLVNLLNGTVYDAIRYLTPEMFGGIADGVTNNDEAFLRINNFVQTHGSCILYLSGGAYALTKWDIPENLMVKGTGKQNSKLICTAPAIQEWFIRCAAKTTQQWQSSISDLGIFAAGRANIALLLSTTTTNGAVSKAHFNSLTVDGGVTDNLVL
ncbi:hypothetical protein RZP54_06680, partial [Raoultella ornithinolytica]|nr:hypothetical protein [Raoultella ornithinolytica]